MEAGSAAVASESVALSDDVSARRPELIPLPLGEGLSAQERSDWLRERVWVERRHSAKPWRSSEKRLRRGIEPTHIRPFGAPLGRSHAISLDPMGEGTGLQAQPACVLAYPSDDPFGLGERLFITETQHRPAEAFQPGLPQMVSQQDVIPRMDAPVDFEDQPEAVAGEVGEVSADRVLAAEPVSVDPCAAKSLP
jgi:hypothetical protein